MGDLKTMQFAQVLSSLPQSDTTAKEQCQWALATVTAGPAARGALVALCALFILLLLVRPPFVVSFEYDKTRPWKGRSTVSWASVCIVAFIAGSAAAALPWLWG